MGVESFSVLEEEIFGLGVRVDEGTFPDLEKGGTCLQKVKNFVRISSVFICLSFRDDNLPSQTQQCTA